MDTTRLLDEIAANATPAPLTRLVDGWLARSAPGLPFRRANCVLPSADAGDDPGGAAATLAALEAWYRERGHERLVVQVPGGPAAVALDGLLAAAGFTIEAPVDVLVAPTPVVAEAGERSGDRFRVSLEEAAGSSRGRLPKVLIAFEDPTLPAFRTPPKRRVKAGQGEDRVWIARDGAYRTMFGASAESVLAPAVRVDGTIVASGFGILERGWCGVFGMGTAQAWRRRGVGGLLVGAVAVEARRRGVEHLYLQVESDNAPAQALYRGLGFTRSHGYHYRVRTLTP